MLRRLSKDSLPLHSLMSNSRANVIKHYSKFCYKPFHISIFDLYMYSDVLFLQKAIHFGIEFKGEPCVNCSTYKHASQVFANVY